MKAFASRMFLAVGLLFLASVAASAQVLPPLSVWKNQRGSLLTLVPLGGTSLGGVFTNFAPGFQCQGIPYPVTGSVLPNGAITFQVNFVACNTVTTWRGRVNGRQMPTRWVLFYNGRRMTGTDLFTMQ